MKTNVMKYIGVCAGLFMFAACAEEDAPVVSYDDPADWFSPAPDAMDETSVLRRDFFDKTGSYLLFNDTVQHKLLGYNLNGDPVYFTELLSIGYTIGDQNTEQTVYTYEYLADIEAKREAVQYLEDNILIHMSSKIKPFSWFLANRITGKNENQTLNPYCVAGQRSIAISCYLLKSLSGSRLKQFNTQILQTIMNRLVENHQAEFTDFYAVCAAYYSGTFTVNSDKENTEILRAHGFLCKGDDSFGFAANGFYPDRVTDLRYFARLLVSYTPEQLKKSYGAYPIVMQKLEILRQTLEELGFNI